jgi:poly(A) polymerase Pap1
MENGDSNWRALFQPSDFFLRYSNFLQVTVRASNAEDFMKWFRLCESRLRILICSLESSEMSSWPFARFMKRAYTPSGVLATGNQSSGLDCMQEALFFIGLKFTMGVGSKNLKLCTSDFLYNHVTSWEGRKPGMDVMLAHVIQRDLPFDLINQHLSNDHPSYSATDEALSNQEREVGVAGSVASVPTAQDKADVMKGGDNSSMGNACPSDTPVEVGMCGTREEEFIRQSPNIARSTIADKELMLMSPTKRPRNNPMLD